MRQAAAPWQVVPLDSKAHNRARFSCGAPERDRSIREHASQDVRRDVARVFVTLLVGGPKRGAAAVSADGDDPHARGTVTSRGGRNGREETSNSLKDRHCERERKRSGKQSRLLDGSGIMDCFVTLVPRNDAHFEGAV